MVRSAPEVVSSTPPVCGYFAYGSNMNPERVRARGLEWTQIGGATLPGFELVFDKYAGHDGAGHANVRSARAGQVHGVLYLLTDAAQIQRMDPFENAPINYCREVFTVQTTTGARAPAWVYIANAALLRPRLLPTAEYMAHLLAGAPWLPRDYHALLRRWPCLPATN